MLSLSNTYGGVDWDACSLPSGWARIKHPDSGVYYVNEDKVRQAVHVLTVIYAHMTFQGVSTSSDVLQPRTHSLIMEGADILERSPALKALLEEQEVALVLDVQLVKGAMKTSYYCVSHAERRVFWLEGIGHEEVDIPCTSNKCTRTKGSRVHCSFRILCSMISMTDYLQGIEAQYW